MGKNRGSRASRLRRQQEQASKTPHRTGNFVPLTGKEVHDKTTNAPVGLTKADLDDLHVEVIGSPENLQLDAEQEALEQSELRRAIERTGLVHQERDWLTYPPDRQRRPDQPPVLLDHKGKRMHLGELPEKARAPDTHFETPPLGDDHVLKDDTEDWPPLPQGPGTYHLELPTQEDGPDDSMEGGDSILPGLKDDGALNDDPYAGEAGEDSDFELSLDDDALVDETGSEVVIIDEEGEPGQDDATLSLYKKYIWATEEEQLEMQRYYGMTHEQLISLGEDLRAEEESPARVAWTQKASIVASLIWKEVITPALQIGGTFAGLWIAAMLLVPVAQLCCMETNGQSFGEMLNTVFQTRTPTGILWLGSSIFILVVIGIMYFKGEDFNKGDGVVLVIVLTYIAAVFWGMRLLVLWVISWFT